MEQNSWKEWTHSGHKCPFNQNVKHQLSGVTNKAYCIYIIQVCVCDITKKECMPGRCELRLQTEKLKTFMTEMLLFQRVKDKGLWF